MTLLIILYIIGCVLSLLRIFAMGKCSNKQFVQLKWERRFKMFSDLKNGSFTIAMILSSWIGFAFGMLCYFVGNNGKREEYFLSFSPVYKEVSN